MNALLSLLVAAAGAAAPSSAAPGSAAPSSAATSSGPQAPAAMQRPAEAAIAQAAAAQAAAGSAAPAAAEPPAAVSPAVAASPTFADTMATAEKPKGFAYNLMNGAVVEQLVDTYLYIKSSAQSKVSITVPVPRDRAFFAKCITGGTPEDLVRGAVINARYDPAGAVRPVIEIVEKVTIEVYEDARVLDRGGKRLYIRAPDGREKGFELEGGPAAWDEVIEGAKFADLVPGSIVRVEHDPGGRQAIKITFKSKPADLNADGSKKGTGRGCGCDVRAPLGPDGGPLALGALLLGIWLRRRFQA